MKKILSALIIIMIVLSIGCSKKEVVKHNYLFKGENEDWTVTYKVDGTGTFIEKNGTVKYDSNCNKLCTFTYKKDISELESIKHIELSYKSSASGGSITEDYEEGEHADKTYKMRSSSTGGAIENKDDVIEVIINIDGTIQTLELKDER